MKLDTKLYIGLSIAIVLYVIGYAVLGGVN